MSAGLPIPKLPILQAPPRSFKVVFCQHTGNAAPGCQQLAGSNCQACRRHAGNCSSTTQGPLQDKVEQRGTRDSQTIELRGAAEPKRIHESQPGQRASRLGRLRSGPGPLTGTAGQRGQACAARWLMQPVCRKAASGTNILETPGTPVSRGPRPPGQETSRSVHRDPGPDAAEALRTPLSPCETPVFSARAQAGWRALAARQRWLCQAKGPCSAGGPAGPPGQAPRGSGCLGMRARPALHPPGDGKAPTRTQEHRICQEVEHSFHKTQDIIARGQIIITCR